MREDGGAGKNKVLALLVTTVKALSGFVICPLYQLGAISLGQV